MAKRRNDRPHDQGITEAEQQALIDAAGAADDPAEMPAEMTEDHAAPGAAAAETTAEEPTPQPAEEFRDDRARNSAFLICPAHQTRLRATATRPAYTWYRCPAEGCETAVKVPRPRWAQGRVVDPPSEQLRARPS